MTISIDVCRSSWRRLDTTASPSSWTSVRVDCGSGRVKRRLRAEYRSSPRRERSSSSYSPLQDQSLSCSLIDTITNTPTQGKPASLCVTKCSCNVKNCSAYYSVLNHQQSITEYLCWQHLDWQSAEFPSQNTFSVVTLAMKFSRHSTLKLFSMIFTFLWRRYIKGHQPTLINDTRLSAHLIMIWCHCNTLFLMEFYVFQLVLDVLTCVH